MEDDAVLTPLPIDDEISSLSAILLNEAYYELLKTGQMMVDDISVLSPTCLIPFKAKAWLDLKERKLNGEQVDSKNIKKHKNDVFRLAQLITASDIRSLVELINSVEGESRIVMEHAGRYYEVLAHQLSDGTEFEIKLRNEMTQKAIAKECAILKNICQRKLFVWYHKYQNNSFLGNVF